MLLIFLCLALRPRKNSNVSLQAIMPAVKKSSIYKNLLTAYHGRKNRRLFIESIICGYGAFAFRGQTSVGKVWSKFCYHEKTKKAADEISSSGPSAADGKNKKIQHFLLFRRGIGAVRLMNLGSCNRGIKNAQQTHILSGPQIMFVVIIEGV